MQIFSFILAFMAALAFPSRSFATENAPVFWDTRQHVATPDLSSVTGIRFLTTTDFFPFNMLDQQGNLIGFHTDLARAICAELNIENRCQIQAMPFDELPAALQDGQGDAIIAGMAITSRTRELYGFTQPYFQFPARFVTRMNEPFGDPLYRSLRGKRVGVIDGSTHQAMLNDLFSGFEIIAFPDEEKLFEAIRNENVTAVFGDGLRLSFAMTSPIAANCCVFAGGPYLSPEYLGHGLSIATRPDQPALVDAINYALRRLEVEDKFTEFYLRYFPINFYEQVRN